MLDHLYSMFSAGGWAMYPLIALSIISVALSFERLVFWLGVNGHNRSFDTLLESARQGAGPKGKGKGRRRRGLYGRFLDGLGERLGSGSASGHELDAVALELLEEVRPSIERFSVTLSTIITAAPMLGILGTVTGIIASFQILGDSGGVTDPVAVAGGVAEALITTAVGLVVALVTLFPFVWARSQSERCLGRLEALVAAAAAGLTRGD
jgi:biopolymer transport protein ExbB